MKKKNNQKDAKRGIISIVIMMLTILIAVAGSYAYYIATIDNTNEVSVIVKSKTLGITFNNGSNFNFDNILPGAKFIKTFTVTNTGTKEMSMDVTLTDVVNQLTNKNEFTYEIKYKDQTLNGEMPSSDANLATNVVIAPDEVITFTLTMEYMNTNSSQNVDMNKVVAGTINVTNVVETGN